MHITSAIFEGSAPDLNACPDESLPEFAFIGRSNVGKSSLLNLLAGQAGLARVSPVPGFTKLINFFRINQTWRLVDLPGYGYAAGAKREAARFNRSVAQYLTRRPNLSLVFVLIDSGLAPQPMDLEFVEWLVGHAVPFVLVYTKIDKEPAAVVEQNLAAFQQQIAPWFVQPPTSFRCSATQAVGRVELLGVIAEILAALPAPAHDQPASRPATPARTRRPDLQRPW